MGGTGGPAGDVAALHPLVPRAVGGPGLGPAEFAAAAHLRPETVTQWALGTRVPNTIAQRAIAPVLDGPDARERLARWAQVGQGFRGPAVRGWSHAEDATIDATRHLPAPEVARMLGRSVEAVTVRRSRLHVRARSPVEA